MNERKVFGVEGRWVMLEPRYITHYLPLFDNSTDDKGRLLDRRDTVEEGSVVFRRDGIVILGHEGFGFTRPIKGVKFGGGCVANRSTSDQVLEITSPTGATFRYRYVARDRNWYQLVLVERAPNRMVNAVHAYREDIADFGAVLGLVIGSVRVAIGLAVYLLIIVLKVGIVVAVGHFTAKAISNGYAHLSHEEVRPMICLAWLLEGGTLGVVILAELAFARGGRLYRQVLPTVFACGFIATAVAFFPNGEAFVRSVTGFLQLNTSRLFESPRLK
ncbi:MAG: hypothetical protein U0795_23505 [Pirellulales bacterium]